MKILMTALLATLSLAVLADGWTVDAKGWWHARLPSGTKCSQFFVNGQRRVRPCVPRRGWFYMDDELQSGNPRQMFRARVNQIDPAWTMDGVEACVIHTWKMYSTVLSEGTAVTVLATESYESVMAKVVGVRSPVGCPGFGSLSLLQAASASTDMIINKIFFIII